MRSEAGAPVASLFPDLSVAIASGAEFFKQSRHERGNLFVACFSLIAVRSRRLSL